MGERGKIRVIVADDHPLVRDGLRLSIQGETPDVTIVGEAGSGHEALELAETVPADIYILDITMPGLNGIEVTRRLVQRNKKARIIMLSLHCNKAFVEEAFEAGASGYLLKESATADVIEAIREVHAGRRFVSEGVSRFFADSAAGRKTGAGTDRRPLTHRETEVLQLIAEGKTSRDIAQTINVAVNTVRVHRRNLMAKLGIHRQADLVRYAVKAGLAKL